MEYKDKIKSAIRLLQSIPQDGPIEICYSGGKDSDVILELAKMARIPYEAIYKQTSICPPHTLQHCVEKGCTVVRPKKTFLRIMEERGMPSRFRRFCCSELKEYKIYDRAVMGIRRSESVRRAARYKEPEECRVYNAKEKVKAYYPILYWTNEDVERFIKERNIKCHPLYYDEEGNFHVERRLGCLGCPLQSDVGLADYKEYPKLLKSHIKAYQKFLDSHTTTKFYQQVRGCAYHAFYHRLFCRTTEKYLTDIDGGLFPELAIDPKKFIQDYFGID